MNLNFFNVVLTLHKINALGAANCVYNMIMKIFQYQIKKRADFINYKWQKN